MTVATQTKTTEWYYTKNEETFGPLELEDIVENVENGTITPMTMVCSTGDPTWMPAIRKQELRPQLVEKEFLPQPGRKLKLDVEDPTGLRSTWLSVEPEVPSQPKQLFSAKEIAESAQPTIVDEEIEDYELPVVKAWIFEIIDSLEAKIFAGSLSLIPIAFLSGIGGFTEAIYFWAIALSVIYGAIIRARAYRENIFWGMCVTFIPFAGFFFCKAFPDHALRCYAMAAVAGAVAFIAMLASGGSISIDIQTQ